MRRPKGRELLEHYERRRPRRFLQFDGFALGHAGADYALQPDEEGDCLTAAETWELMRGATVRVLIDPKTSPAQAVRLLGKIGRWIERDGFGAAQSRAEGAGAAGPAPDLPF